MYFIHFIIYFAINIHTNLFQLNNSVVNCSLYKDKFGIATSQFTSCAITNAKPIKLCESCVDLYIDVLATYHNLSLVSDKSGPCIFNYINLDRLGIMKTLYQNSCDLWNRAKCSECFEAVDGILTHNHSEKADKFNELYNTTANCIYQIYSNKTDLCANCMDPYFKLNDFYNSISNENENIPVCMDIVDMMNDTRSFWSENCCLYRHHSEYVFLTSTACMFLLTVLFYTLTKMCTDKKSAEVYLQSRFAESRSNINT